MTISVVVTPPSVVPAVTAGATVVVTPSGGTSSAIVGAALRISVANIDDPSTELAAVTGTLPAGTIRIATQDVVGANAFRIYVLDAASSTVQSTPNRIDRTAGGQWVLVGGKGVAGGFTVETTLVVSGTSTFAGIDATSIGATTPGTGKFTTVTATGLTVGSVPYVSTGGLLAVGGLLWDNSNTRLEISAASGVNRDINGCTAGSRRWILRLGTSTAESGSDAGSDFHLIARTDTDGTIDTPLTIARAASGVVTFNRPITLSTTSSGLTISKTSGQTFTVSSTATVCSAFGGGATFGSTIAVSRTVDGQSTISNTNVSTGTAALASDTIVSDTAALALRAYGSANSSTDFGTTRGGYAGLYCTAGSGLFIGCLSLNAPIIFGASAAELARFTSGTLSSGTFAVKYTTASTTAVTGAITCAGGLGVAGDCYFGTSATVVQIMGRLKYTNAGTAYQTADTNPVVYSTNSTGGAYPFTEAGNLVISPRISGASRDVVISVAGTTHDFKFDRAGALTIAATTASTTTATGCLILGGGIGVAGAGTFGGLITAAGLNSSAQSTYTVNDSSTAAVSTAIIARHNSSGTPAANFGTGIQLQGESDTTENRAMGAIEATWVVATDASRTARFRLYAYDTAERECIRMQASGSAAMVGFLGASAIVRFATTGTTSGFTAGAGTAVLSDSTFTGGSGATAYTIGDLVLALKNYGLLTA
jgi:hypothetical protein